MGKINEADWDTTKVRGTVQEICVSMCTGEVVVLGYLDRHDEQHNCDAMGCGQSHVLWRGCSVRYDGRAQETNNREIARLDSLLALAREEIGRLRDAMPCSICGATDWQAHHCMDCSVRRIERLREVDGLVEHSELSGHIDIAEQCRDWLLSECVEGADPSGKLHDFVESLRIVIDQLDRQRRSRNWYEAAYTAGKQKLIEHATEKLRAELDRMRPIYEASLELRHVESTDVPGESIAELEANVPAAQRRSQLALTKWRNAIDAAKER